MAKETGDSPTAEQDPPAVTDEQVFEPDDRDLGQAVLDAAHDAALKGPTNGAPKPDPDSKGGDQAADGKPAPTEEPSAETTPGHDRDKGLQKLQQRVEDQHRQISDISETLTTGIERLTSLIQAGHQPVTPEETTNGTPAETEAVPSIDDIVKGIDVFDEASLATGLSEVVKVAEGNASKALQTQLTQLQETVARIDERSSAPQREADQKAGNARAIQAWVDEHELPEESFNRLVDAATKVVTDSGTVDRTKDPQTFKDQVIGAFNLLTQQEKAAVSKPADETPKPSNARSTPADTAGTQLKPDGARTTQGPTPLDMHGDLPINAMDVDPKQLWDER